MLEWRLTGLFCNTLDFIEQRVPGSNVTLPLSNTCEARCTISLEEKVVSKIEPLKTGLYVEYFGVPVFHGPILEPNFNYDSGVVEVPAVDASEWAKRGYHYVTIDWLDTVDDQNSIVWDTISRRFIDYRGVEDVYLARIIKGSVPVSQIRRTLRAEIGQNTWQPVLNVNALESGPEFEIEPLPPDVYYDRGAGVYPRCAAWGRLNVASRLGQDRENDIRFEYGFGEDNAAGFQDIPRGASVKNLDTARGQTDSSGVQITRSSQNASSRDEYGTWEGYESTQFTDAAVIQSAAQQQVSAYGRPPKSFVVSPAMEWMRREDTRPYGVPPKFLSEYGVGDSIYAAAQRGEAFAERVGRITKATITEVDAHMNTRVDLECVPRVLATGVT